jgi:hypothetical protein
MYSGYKDVFVAFIPIRSRESTCDGNVPIV